MITAALTTQLASLAGTPTPVADAAIRTTRIVSPDAAGATLTLSRARANTGIKTQIPTPPALDPGWVRWTPNSDSRIVYFDPDNGNDSTARVYAKAQITSGDPFFPGFTPAAFKTVAAAYAQIRDSYPDWLLCRSGMSYVGALPDWKKAGRSSTERMVVGFYGTGDLPLFLYANDQSGLSLYANQLSTNLRHLAFVNLRFLPANFTQASQNPIGINIIGQVSDVILDGVISEQAWKNWVIQDIDDGLGHTFRPFDLTLFRCQGNDAKDYTPGNPTGTCVGIYISGTAGGKIRIIEGVFDRNGVDWPSIFRHNIYVQVDAIGVEIYNTLHSRGWISLEHRAGGINRGNVGLDNSFHFVLGNVSDSMDASWLVCLDSHDIDPTNNDLNLGVGIQAAGNETGNHIEITDFICSKRTPAAGYNVSALSTANIIEYAAFRRGVVYGWANNGSGAGFFLGGSSVTPGGVIVEAVDIQQPGGGQVFVDYLRASPVISGGRQYSPTSLAYQSGNDPQTRGTFELEHLGDSSTVAAVTYPDPTRDASRYMAAKGQVGALDAFMTKARANVRSNWSADWTAKAIGDYIRAGFGFAAAPASPSALGLVSGEPA